MKIANTRLMPINLLVLWALLPSVQPQRLSVMTWNTWIGGWRVDEGPEKVANEVTELDPDIVFLQETHQRACIEKILAKRQYKECQPRAYSVSTLYKASKFTEIKYDTHSYLSPKTSNRHQVCQLRFAQSEKKLTLVNVNLDDNYYGPELACGIKNKKFRFSVADSIKFYELERRISFFAPLLYRLEAASHLSDEIVIAAGDFGSPSSLDYLKNDKEEANKDRVNPEIRAQLFPEEAATKEGGQKDEKCGPANFKWPVTELMSRHKFLDSFREVHRDPKDNLGITYSPVYNGSTTVTNQRRETQTYPQDRRDYIYYRPGTAYTIIPTNATVYHKTPIAHAERYSYPDAPAERQVRENDWPSDHSAVIAKFWIP